MEIQNLERRNSEYALFEWKRELEFQKTAIIDVQIKLTVLCSELEMKSRLHRECYTRSCQEIEELKRGYYQEENAVKQRKLEEFTTQHDQESRTVNQLRDQVRRSQERLEFIEDPRIFQDSDITSSSRKPSRESRMQRNTREGMNIPGNAFDCQPVRRDPDELHNTSKNLATSSGILRREGSEKSGSEEQLQSIPLRCFSGESKGKESRRRKLSYVYDKPCCGYWDLYSKWHENTELSFLGDASGQNSLNTRNFRAGL